MSIRDKSVLHRNFWSSRRGLNNLWLCSSASSYSKAKERSGNQSSLHALILCGRDMLAHLRRTVEFIVSYLMELCRNYFLKPAAIRKDKIRKVACFSPNSCRKILKFLGYCWKKRGVTRVISPLQLHRSNKRLTSFKLVYVFCAFVARFISVSLYERAQCVQQNASSSPFMVSR